MSIEIIIKADELTAAIGELAAAIKLSAETEAQLNATARELTIPAGTPLTVTEVKPAEPEKPKRKRTSKMAAELASETPQEQQPEQTAPTPEPAAEASQDAPELGGPQYGEPAQVPTKEQIGAAGAKMLDDNPDAMPQLLALLDEYGVQAIMQLKDDQLPGFTARMRALGAEV